MSEEMIESLTNENAGLKNAIDQAKANNQSLTAQLEAHQGMLSESIQNCLILRANVLILQKQLKDSKENNNATREV